jgi:Ribbon-helix-helix protein, copG family
MMGDALTMRRIQIRIDEALDAAVAAEAARRGLSKGALIRSWIVRELRSSTSHHQADPWEAMIGWLDDEPVNSLDEAVYGAR